MAKAKYRRRKKLIEPRFQLRVAFAAIAIAIVSVMTLMVVFNQSLVEMIDRGWINASVAHSGWVGMMVQKLIIALAILVPLSLSLGVVLSHRVAGPMYRFRVFLQDVKEGRQVRDCKVRTGDEYQDFCDLLNEVTAPLREANGRNQEDDDQQHEAAA